MNRRTFLATSVAAAVGVAGCSGNGGNSNGSGTQLADHAAATNIDQQPTLGTDPTDAEGLVVAFEDPSCTRCRAFEETVVPKIRSNLVEPGKGAFVFRGYPVVYDWGDPASHALEATYARDEDAFWSLADHYFSEQDAFRSAGTSEVYPRTREFLADQTNLDAEAVVSDARNGGADDAIQTDLDAGMNAGAGRTTPHIFLFRNGEFQTKAAGSISYDTIETVLQL